MLESSDRDKLTAEAICASYLLRSCECWKELSDATLAANGHGNVFEVARRPVFPGQRIGIDIILVRVMFFVHELISDSKQASRRDGQSGGRADEAHIIGSAAQLFRNSKSQLI
jgi:hypothetical protein